MSEEFPRNSMTNQSRTAPLESMCRSEAVGLTMKCTTHVVVRLRVLHRLSFANIKLFNHVLGQA